MVRRSRVGATLICATSLLGGCATLETETPDASAEAAAPVVVSEPQVAALPTIPVPKRKPAPPAPVFQISPKSLVGLNQEATVALLGKTTDVRTESTATVWKYRTEDCELEVFFYLEVPSQTYRALTYDLKTAADSDYATRSCLGLIKAKYSGE
jgi:hypothetical protein